MKKGFGCLILFLVLASPVIVPMGHAIYLEKKAARMGRHLDDLSEAKWKEVFDSAKHFHASRWTDNEVNRERLRADDLPLELRSLGFDYAAMDAVGLSFMFGSGMMQGGASVSIYIRPPNHDPAHIIFNGWRRHGIAYLEGGIPK